MMGIVAAPPILRWPTVLSPKNKAGQANEP
jgi:hypothetical protein